MEQDGPALKSSRLANKYPAGWSVPGLVPKRKYTVTEKVGRPKGRKEEQGRRKRGSNFRRSAADNLQGHAGPAHATACAVGFCQPMQRVLAELETAFDHLARLPATQRASAKQEVLALLQERGIFTAHAPSPAEPTTDLATTAVATESTPAAPQSTAAGQPADRLVQGRLSGT